MIASAGCDVAEARAWHRAFLSPLRTKVDLAKYRYDSSMLEYFPAYTKEQVCTVLMSATV